MDQNTFTLLTGGLFLYNSTFSDVNNLGESLRERLFCKKNCKGARVGGRDAREDCSQGGLRYQRGYPPSFPSLSLFFFSLSLLLIPAMHQLDEISELLRSDDYQPLLLEKKQVSWAPTCMCPRRASTRWSRMARSWAGAPSSSSSALSWSSPSYSQLADNIYDDPSKRLGVGKAFGELAILYNCKRTASIKVSGWLWSWSR